jgi:hypothetical protein
MVYRAFPHINYFKTKNDMFFLAEEYEKLKHEWEATNIYFQNASSFEDQQKASLKLQAISEAIHDMDLHVQVIDHRKKALT